MAEYRGRKIWGAATTVMVVAGMISLPGVAYAADAGGGAEIEEIVVTGIRGSLEKAFNVKREADSFVDVVTTVDIGKLPDQNVAEALQRVPGVAIERSRGEGNFVSIRGLGPEYVRATLNGRTITSGEVGREFNFDVLPAESISLLEVIKSPTASLEEGGIGGTVDIHTARPIDLGSRAAHFSVKLVNSDLADKTDPRFSGSYSWVNDDATRGFMVNASYSDASIREDRLASHGWSAPSTLSANVVLDLDNDGIGDSPPGEQPLFPVTGIFGLVEEERERRTINGAFQFEPDDTLAVNVDFLYSEFDQRSADSNAVEPMLVYEGMPNEDGSYPVSDLTLLGNTVIAFTHTGFRMETIQLEQDLGRKTSILGVNLVKTLDHWDYTGDVYYTRAETDLFDRQGVLELTRVDPDKRTVDEDGKDPGVYRHYEGSWTFSGFVPTIRRTVDLADPANYTTRNQRTVTAANDDNELGFRFDAGHNELGLKFGLGYRSRTKERGTSRIVTNTGKNLLIDGIYTTLPDGISNGGSVDVDNLLFPVVGTIHDYVYDQGDTPAEGRVLQPEPLNSFEVEENVLSAYVQYDLEGSVGDIPYTGNVGVRLVDTDQTSSGTAPTSLRIITTDGIGTVESETGPVSFDNSYTNILPSLNLAFELADDLVLRFAASKTVTRPTLNDLAPRLSINATNFAASAGNPELDPFTATSFDLGVEWYFAGSSALYGVLFHKKIDDLVVQVTQVETIGEVTFTGFGGVTRPRNADTADVDGLELGYTHAYQSGFGVASNITYTDSTAEFDSSSVTDAVFTLEGLSEISYNLAVFYEQGPWQARIAYNYRDEFVQQTIANYGNTRFVNDYAQLDASISYAITSKYTLFAEGVNITDSEEERFVNVEERPVGLRIVGPRYSIGFRGSF